MSYIHGSIAEMESFNLTPPGSISPVNGSSAGGGMPEGAEFAKAAGEAAEELSKFVTDVQSGFTHYTTTVQSAATDYRRADSSGSRAIDQSRGGN